MKRISLDIFRIGKTKDERKTRFEQSNEDRVNMNFKRLQQAIEEVNTEKADGGDAYTKAEADALLSEKANSADVVPKSGGTFTGDVTFNEDVTVGCVLDVTQMRCYATLSSAGWYRVMIADYPSAEVGFMRGKAAPLIRFGISRKGDAVTSETHEILLMSGGWDVIKFVDEKSACSSLLIDKIRYTYNSSNSKACVDIHYNASNSNAIGVTLDVTAPTLAIFGQIKAASLQAVADAPSSETILTTYEFSTNAIPLRYTVTTVPILVTDYGTAKFTYNAIYYDLGKIGIVYFNPPTSVLQGQEFSTLLQLENLPFSVISASGFVRSLGSNQDGMDTWQLSDNKIYLRKRGGGNLLGTFLANPILQVTIIGIKNG